MKQYAIPTYRSTAAAPTAGLFRFRVPVAGTLQALAIFNGVAVAGSAVILDINLNGTTIFPTQSDRPSIGIGDTTDAVLGLNVAVVRGDIITVDVDQGTVDTCDVIIDIEDGISAGSPVWRGAWSGATTYVVNDAVLYQGSSWRAIAGSTNIVPSEGITWNLLASKGDTGPQGAQGIQGIQGIQGEPGSGGGGSSYDGDTLGVPAPSSPHAMDDEFSNSVLNSKWSWYNQGTAIVTPNSPIAGRLNMRSRTDLLQWAAIRQNVPSTSATWTATIRIGAEASGFAYRAGILVFFTDGSFHSFEIKRDGGAQDQTALSSNKWSAAGGLSTTGGVRVLGSNTGYLKVIYYGGSNNIDLYFSADGVAWMYMMTTSHPGLVLDKVGIGLISGFNVASDYANAHFDFFRVEVF